MNRETLKQEYRDEKGYGVYGNDYSLQPISQEYVKWIEDKLIALKQSENVVLDGVSSRFMFLDFVNRSYEYYDNTDKGNVYKNKITSNIKTEKEVWEHWYALNDC